MTETSPLLLLAKQVFLFFCFVWYFPCATGLPGISCYYLRVITCGNQIIRSTHFKLILFLWKPMAKTTLIYLKAAAEIDILYF